MPGKIDGGTRLLDPPSRSDLSPERDTGGGFAIAILGSSHPNAQDLHRGVPTSIVIIPPQCGVPKSVPKTLASKAGIAARQ